MNTQKIKAQLVRSGFSLIEILVVVAILAGLAAIAFPVANKMLKSGNLEKNREMVKSLEIAVDRFYNEYGYFPVELTEDEELTDAEVIDMLIELEGSEDNLEYNIKGINFLEGFAEGKNGRGGIIRLSTGKIDDLKSTFKQPFEVILDGDYDKTIDPPALRLSDEDEVVKGKRILIWTKGEDDQVKEDIITNWR